MGKMACAYCGTPNDEAHRFCMHCGRAIDSERDAGDREGGGSATAPPAEGEAAGADGTSDVGTPTRVVGPVPCPVCDFRNLPELDRCERCGERLHTDPSVESASTTPDAPSSRVPDPPASEAPDVLPPEVSDAPPSDVPDAPAGTQLFVSRPVRDEARLVQLLTNGETEVYEVGDAAVIGRIEGEIRHPEDPYLSARHARVRRRRPGFVLEDLDSTNGTFVRIDEEIELQPGDQILIGGQILEFVV